MADKITPGQIRAARALLDWSMIDLANAATVSVSTIKRAEDDGSLYVTDRIIACIRDAFETNGVRFLPDNGDGPGLRYKAG